MPIRYLPTAKISKFVRGGTAGGKISGRKLEKGAKKQENKGVGTHYKNKFFKKFDFEVTLRGTKRINVYTTKHLFTFLNLPTYAD